MRFPTIEEMARGVAEKALVEYEYKGKTLRKWIEIILATDNNVGTKPGTNFAEVGTDCISRQAAIDALCNDYCGGHQDCKYYPNCENLRSVQKLPSAQPEIVRCKDCKHNPKYEWFGCPMSHLSEKQRPETAWCWKAERRTDERSDMQTGGD